MKNTWKGIKNIININNNRGSQINQLKYNGKNINNDVGKANAFNDIFTNVGPTLDNNIPNSINLRDPKTYLSSRVPPTLLLEPTTSQEIRDSISTLDDSKSSGPSSIPTKLLKIVT